MDLRACYAALGGSYDEVIGRLRSERLVRKFVLKFLDDGSFDLLCRSVAAQDQPEAFRAAHTLKGVCQNLSFDALFRSSNALTEALRESWSPDAPQLLEKVRSDYDRTAAAIRELDPE